ncbi:MAG: NUDIX domain-containing protein, partial [Acidimicrobiales bacterium]
MPRSSAGLMLYRVRGNGELEVLLAHPGGPWFARKDHGAWTVPKGEYEAGEEPAAAADREFAEEIGQVAPSGERIDLGEVRQTSGKRVRCYAVEGDLEAGACHSNLFEMEWPPGSGSMQRFPEVDRAEWFASAEAKLRLNPAQAP